MASTAGKESPKSFEDVDSDDFSLEVSVATDFTATPDNSEREEAANKKRRICKRLAERKQLIHDMHMLRVELSQKNLSIESLKTEHVHHIEDLEERLHNLTYQNQILQARLESEVQMDQEDAKKRQKSISMELEILKTKQQFLETANERLLEKAGHLRHSLRDLNLSTEQYYQLKSLPEDNLSLRDYIAVRVYDTIQPLQTELDQLRMTGRAQDDQLAASAAELVELKERLEMEHELNAELRAKLQKMSENNAGKAQLNTDDTNCKALSNNQVKYEQDDLMRSQEAQSQRQLSIVEGAHTSLLKERDDLVRELATVQQAMNLLKQDKDYLNRQLSDSVRRASLAEDRLQQLSQQLDDARQSREEMYEKYVTSRDQYKLEYEKKLQEEVDMIRASMNAEMDRLRTSTKDMYERENRNLREARDTALGELDRLKISERDLHNKHEQLTTQFHEMQARAEGRVFEMHNELKVKSFEAERSHMVCEETMSNLKDKAMEVELLQKKAEMLRKEYHSLETAMEKRVVELETQLSERNNKLDTYERLEKDLDQVILQAADMTDDYAAEKVLFSYGYGTNVPTTAKRRVQQSVQLAKRVLQLERANSSLRREVDEEKRKGKQLADELEKSSAMLDQTQQPYNYLVDSIRERDDQLKKHQKYIQTLETDLRQVGEEKEKLLQSQQQMSQDLQRLLNQREEMLLMKQAVVGLSARLRGQPKACGNTSRSQPASHPLSRNPSRSLASQRSPPSQSHSDLEHSSYSADGSAPQSTQARIQPTQCNKKKKKIISSHKTSVSRVFDHFMR